MILITTTAVCTRSFLRRSYCKLYLFIHYSCRLDLYGWDKKDSSSVARKSQTVQHTVSQKYGESGEVERGNICKIACADD
jgi:hypothetical protein